MYPVVCLFFLHSKFFKGQILKFKFFSYNAFSLV